MTPAQLAWVPCDRDDCDAGLAIDVRHLGNFEGRGYVCPEHGKGKTSG